MIICSYPHSSQKVETEYDILVKEKNQYKLRTIKKTVTLCLKQVRSTRKLYFFDSTSLVFRNRTVFDPNLKESTLIALVSAGFWGFRYKHNIIAITEEELFGKQRKKKVVSRPMSNIDTSIRLTFDEWLERYDI